MITVLKGSPSYNIGSDGLMTIATTWMCMPNAEEGLNAVAGWLAFQNDVEAWAGGVGDAYKKPTIESGREATSYIADSTFIVQDVDYKCVDGRTHYEVSYTNVQNLAVMKQIGNVSVEVNNNKEKSKTITYQIDVEKNNPLAIDEKLIESGTSVIWAGDEYLVESSSYQAQSPTRYVVTITAKDMSVMMVGNPTSSTDQYGQKTKSAVWRYSNSAFTEWIQPIEGSDASSYIGGDDGYLVSSVNVSPDGVLGYTVTIEAVHVSKKLLHSSVRESRNREEHTIVYQSDSDSVADFKGIVFTPADDYGAPDTTVTEVNIDEAGRGNYEVTLTTAKDSTFSGTESLANQVDVNMSQSAFVLEPKHCGWEQSVSGIDYYTVNFPPSTIFTYQQTLNALVNKAEDTGNQCAGYTESDALSIIKAKGKFGYDRVLRVISGGKEVNGTDLAAITASTLDYVIMQGNVYAQPNQTNSGGKVSIRNIYFLEWENKKECPLYLQTSHRSNYPKKDGRDLYFDKRYVNYSAKMLEYNVTMNYIGNTSTTLRRAFSYYYKRAISYIKTTNATSYKGAGLQVSEIKDGDGKIWTAVTCTIHALMEYYWNPLFDNSYVED